MISLRRVSWISPLVLALSAGCGDDSPSLQGGSSAGGGAPEGGAGGSGGSGGDATSGPSCTENLTAGSLAAGTWDDRFTVAGLTGMDGFGPAVHDFARDVDGSVVAAGRFQYFAGGTVPPLVRLVDGAWVDARATWEIAPPLDGFSAIAISDDGKLALATNDSFGEPDGELWIDDGSGLVSVGGFSGKVRSLAWLGDELYVGGLFALDDDASVTNLARWDGTILGAPEGGSADGPVFELTVSASMLYAGGAFSTIGGGAAANVASFDGTSWTAYDFPDALLVYAIARTDGGALYAGGAFGDFGAPGGLASWNGSAWETVGGGLGQFQTRGVVIDAVAHGETVDVMGCFNAAGGLSGEPSALPTRSFARWTGAAWEEMASPEGGVGTPWFLAGTCGDEGPTAVWDVDTQRLLYDGGSLYAGGFFAGVDGVASQSIAVHDEADGWLAQGQAGLGFAGSLDAIATGGEGCEAYGVGSFTHVAGERANGRVVHYRGTGWEVLADDLPSDAYCPAVAVSPAGEVAVGCMVFPQEGAARGVILKRDGDAMVEVRTEGLGPVTTVAYSPSGALFVAGTTEAGGYLARLDGATITTIEGGFDGVVNRIDVRADDDIIVAGAFTKIGEAGMRRIAHWDGKLWSSYGEGLDGQVLALARSGERVFVSTYDEGAGALLLGSFDGTEWKELATPQSGVTKQTYFSFNALVVVGDDVIAGGTAELDDGTGRGLLVFTNGAFSALQGGVRAINVSQVAAAPGNLWVAGAIAEAGSPPSQRSSVGVAHLTF